jgi:hypothetical protein
MRLSRPSHKSSLGRVRDGAKVGKEKPLPPACTGGHDIVLVTIEDYICCITRLQRAAGSRAVWELIPSGLCFWCRMRTIVYVDGFYLYYRLLKSRLHLKWVNPLALAKEILKPPNNVIKVRYFTARVSGRLDPDAPARQQLYLDAIAGVPEIEIHFGSFLEKPKYAGLVKPKLAPGDKLPFLRWPDVAYVWKTEEKGSDVALASYLLLDAFQNNFDVAAVLSNDSDLVEPIRIATQILEKSVGLLSPVPSPTPQLQETASFIRHVRVSDIAKAQFPNPVILPGGKTISKPESWTEPPTTTPI